MRKLIMTLVLIMGTLFGQAQINVCDSLTVTGTQNYITVEANNINTIIDSWNTTCTGGFCLATDTLTNIHYIQTGGAQDTLITCITYGMGMTMTCCVTWIWDGNMWLKMGVQQPYFCCDSITYWTDHSQGFNIGLDTSNIIHNPDSMEVLWQICNADQCYSGQGMYDYFPQIMTTDTLKVCYDVMLWESGVLEVCTSCDSLIFDQGINNWVLFSSQGNPTGIFEFEFIEFIPINGDNKIYDLLGREVTDPQIGQMYIRNNKKYIQVR